jgi:hypothetical protein
MGSEFVVNDCITGEGLLPLVVATWNDGTVSIIKMPAGFTVGDVLQATDSETSSLPSAIYEFRPDRDGLHITFDREEFLVGAPVRVGTISGRVRRVWVHNQG